jgi:hypothetical protein
MIMGITAFHYFVNFTQGKESGELILSIFSIINPTVTGVAALVVSFNHQYKDLGLRSKSFRYSYVAFGIAFLAAGGGEVLYFISDHVLEQPTFPSLVDILFVPFYPLILIYLYLNTRFFKPVFGVKHFGITILPTLIIVFYLVFLVDHEPNPRFFISLYYVVVSAISLAITIYATLIFKDSLVGKTWTLLLLGMITFTLADIVYYNLEVVNGYSLSHPVNLLWYVGYWIITYSLYKHPRSN